MPYPNPNFPVLPRSKLEAEPGARLNLLPLLGARGGDSIEDTIRVVLLPDLEQLGVVGAPESLLPVGLVGIGLP